MGFGDPIPSTLFKPSNYVTIMTDINAMLVFGVKIPEQDGVDPDSDEFSSLGIETFGGDDSLPGEVILYVSDSKKVSNNSDTSFIGKEIIVGNGWVASLEAAIDAIDASADAKDTIGWYLVQDFSFF